VTQRLSVDFSAAIGSAINATGRDPEHVAKAALLALAVAARGIRDEFGLDIEAWAQANRIAQTPSLTTTAALLPATTKRLAALKAG
jgi:hypothetical protein